MEDVTQENQRITNTRADQLNQQCYCVTLDRKALNESLLNQFVGAGNEASATPELDHLFSNTPVFVPHADIESMERIVQAIESAAELPLYRERVLSWAPEIAGFDSGPLGAFMGYDFLPLRHIWHHFSALAFSQPFVCAALARFNPFILASSHFDPAVPSLTRFHKKDGTR